MRTIYTDKLGLYPWAMLLVSGVMFWSAYSGLTEGDGNRIGLGVGAGALFLILALKRFWDVRQAKLEGRDPTIFRIENAPDQ